MTASSQKVQLFCKLEAQSIKELKSIFQPKFHDHTEMIDDISQNLPNSNYNVTIINNETFLGGKLDEKVINF